MKPHPSIFRAALELMGVRPDEAAMVGDSVPHDVAGAQQAGMRPILLARSGDLAQPSPDVVVIPSLLDLPAVLDRDE
jgi:putative hydrolase of the HAD superfamily